MEQKKKIIICIIFILFILIITLGLILLKLNNDNQNEKTESNINNSEYIDGSLEGKDAQINYDEESISSLITKYDYNNIQKCSEIYQNAINELIQNNNEENKTKLLNMLDEEYIKIKNINQENINKLYEKNSLNDFVIDEIYLIKISNGVNAYIVKGKLINQTNSTKLEYELIIKLDLLNNTFSIYPHEYVLEKGYNKLKEGDTINIQKSETIENKTYNVYEDQTNRYSTIAIPYFQKLKSDMQYDVEYLYNLLDSDYKQKRFESLENFKKYININKDKISNMQIQKYARYYYDGYIQYVCIDNNGNYYIFNETSTMKYTVLLDTYTIDQPSFIEKYEAATDQNKAGMNINKFMLAINAEDYKYAYNCLADSFKQNNFPTLESFERYIKSNFYSTNKFEYTSYTKESGYHVYSVNISNSVGNGEIKQKNFIINLKENREFEMSFSMD